MPTAFKVPAKIISFATSMTEAEEVLLYFTGLFFDVPEGRIWLPEGIKPKDYDKYEKSKPYLLQFSYEQIELYTPEYKDNE
jgi:hypothetical protein